MVCQAALATLMCFAKVHSWRAKSQAPAIWRPASPKVLAVKDPWQGILKLPAAACLALFRDTPLAATGDRLGFVMGQAAVKRESGALPAKQP